jgi:hypothetical protein
MKPISAIFLTIIFLFSTVFRVSAQSADTIWIEATDQNYSVGEVITVNLYGMTSIPIQGFAFQLSYDPTCIQPEQPSSSQTGMNSFPLPQETGLLDVSFYSTAPQPISGPLTEIKFTTLSVCETTIKLENASLMILDETGIAHPLDGITLGTNAISLSVGNSVEIPTAVAPKEPQSNGDTSSAPVQPVSTLIPVSVIKDSPFSDTFLYDWFGITLSIFLVMIAVFIGLVFFIKPRTPATKPIYQPISNIPVLFIKHGPRAGEFVELTTSPFQIGRASTCELQLNDSRISRHHAQISANSLGYDIVDLGSKNKTFVNGKSANNHVVPLKPGDLVQLGKGISLVFTMRRKEGIRI